MKVRELIEQLSKLPQDAEVLVSSDSEGNSYDMAYEVDVMYYLPGNDEYWPIALEDIEAGEYDDLTVDDLTQAVCIWP